MYPHRGSAAVARGPSVSWPVARRWVPSPAQVLLWLIASRVLLIVPALIGARFFLVAGAVPGFVTHDSPRALPGIWERWDAGTYLDIAQHGYPRGTYEVVFFPAYPVLAHVFSLGHAAWLTWAAYAISNVCFVAAAYLFWRQVTVDLNERVALFSLLALDLFPTSFFFSAIYPESLFLLLSVLVYRFSARGQYLSAALCVSLASLTRPTGFFLAIIPLIYLWQHRRKHSRWMLPVTATVAGASIAIYSLYLRVTRGSAVAYAQQSRAHWGRYFTVPWRPIADSLHVVVHGYAGGALWPRLVNLTGVATAVLFVAVAIASWQIVGPGLAVYLTGSLLFLLSSHGAALNGLESLSRYVLPLFPGFIVLGVALERMGRWKWPLLLLSTGILYFLTLWYASGRWVA